MFLVSPCSCICPIHWSHVFKTEDEDVVGAAPTGVAPTISEWPTILLPTTLRFVSEVRRYVYNVSISWHHHNIDKLLRVYCELTIMRDFASDVIQVFHQSLSYITQCIKNWRWKEDLHISTSSLIRSCTFCWWRHNMLHFIFVISTTGPVGTLYICRRSGETKFKQTLLFPHRNVFCELLSKNPVFWPNLKYQSNHTLFALISTMADI